MNLMRCRVFRLVRDGLTCPFVRQERDELSSAARVNGTPKDLRLSSYVYGLAGTAIAAAAIAGAAAACNDPMGLDTSKLGATVTSAGGSDAAAPNPGDLTNTFNEDCPAGDDWTPADGGPPPPVRPFVPAPHPDTECPFYRGAYQNFLIATHPNGSGDPDLLNYATLDDTFQTSYPTGFVRNSGPSDPKLSPDPFENPGGAAAATAVQHGPPTGRAWLGVVRQAGQRNVAIDQDHHTLYYGLHMNQAFVDFVQQNNLQTVQGIMKVDPNLEFPPGVAEFKTAWKDIDPRDFPDSTGALGTPNGKVSAPTDFSGDPGDYSNYITTMAWLPWLTQGASTGTIQEDPNHPVLRKVALVAIHAVYTLPGHPEFIWGSVQHVNITQVDPDVQAFAGVTQLGMPDTQPSTTGPGGMAQLPNPDVPVDSITTPPGAPGHHYLMFAPGTLMKDSLTQIPDLQLAFDEPSQTFKGQVTNDYRIFPGSKSNTLQPDTAVFSLNSNLNVLFKNAISAGVMDPNKDKRQNYRLVAAVWMDKPALFGIGTQQTDGTYPGLTFQNDDGTNPLIFAAQHGEPLSNISQGVTCGTPTGLQGQPPLSGDAPGATALNNTVPGCDSRADDMQLPHFPNPQHEADGGPINPALDYSLQPPTLGTDSPFSILGGEDRLSSTVMETFTQDNTFHNCFSCHNTQPINSFGVAADPHCLPQNNPPASLNCPDTPIPFAAKINVSHMFSEFVLREKDAANRADGGTP